jgi:UDP-3-O-[3-hydroxymyristoyl] N-acetylglucosamine deacetylase/3-hydroxyacyl-[acyl-carrier-protein] dehydratase
VSGGGDGPRRQRTLGAEVSLEGVGLHTGKPVKATLVPSGPDTGIVFRRMDVKDQPELEATVENVAGTSWETVLGRGDATVGTIEHLLAPLTVFGIDNLQIQLEGPEPPALDGSGQQWCSLISEAGIEDQEGTSPRVVVVHEPFSVREGDSSYTIAPHGGYRVTAIIDFDHPSIGRQSVTVEVEPDSFCSDVAPARTFGLESWRDMLHARGLALGANYDNTIVATDDGLAEGTELRYSDEFVRHKILDLVGDLALVGARLQAHIIAERPSHRGNVAVARRLRNLLARPERGGPVLDINGILDYIPHRYPFLLIDRVIEFEGGKRILGLKNVTINEPFFQGHFPGHPIMPGVLIVEAMAQAGGLLLMNEFDDPQSKVVYFMSLDDVKFRKPVMPGDQLLFELRMLQLRGRTCRMQGETRVDGEVVAEATMMARVMDK